MPRGALQNGSRYVALDELLEIPRVKILRTLRHFDWASSEDIHVALDVLESVDKRSSDALNSAIWRLAREGLIDHVGTTHINRRYRINDRGRASLKQMLGRAEICESVAP